MTLSFFCLQDMEYAKTCQATLTLLQTTKFVDVSKSVFSVLHVLKNTVKFCVVLMC